MDEDVDAVFFEGKRHNLDWSAVHLQGKCSNLHRCEATRPSHNPTTAQTSLQSGAPLFIYTGATCQVQRINPLLPVSPTNLEYLPGSGDFSASGYNLDLRLDAFNLFNLFNQVNFYGLDANLQDGSFGSVGSTHTARYLQVGATITS